MVDRIGPMVDRITDHRGSIRGGRYPNLGRNPRRPCARTVPGRSRAASPEPLEKVPALQALQAAAPATAGTGGREGEIDRWLVAGSEILTVAGNEISAVAGSEISVAVSEISPQEGYVACF